MIILKHTGQDETTGQQQPLLQASRSALRLWFNAAATQDVTCAELSTQATGNSLDVGVVNVTSLEVTVLQSDLSMTCVCSLQLVDPDPLGAVYAGRFEHRFSWSK